MTPEKALGYKESKIGTVKINRHQDDNLFEAAVITATGFKVGDLVKPRVHAIRSL